MRTCTVVIFHLISFYSVVLVSGQIAFSTDGVEIVQCADKPLNLSCATGHVVTFSTVLLGVKEGTDGSRCYYDNDDCLGTASRMNDCRWKMESCALGSSDPILACGPKNVDYIAALDFQCIAAGLILPMCVQNETSNSMGYITTDGYPGPPTPSKNCELLVKPPVGVSSALIHGVEIDIDTSGSATCDNFITITVHPSGQSIGPLCKAADLVQTNVTGTHFVIKYHFGNANDVRGFLLFYTFDEASVSSANYPPSTDVPTSPVDTASSPVSSVTVTPSSTAVITPTSTMAAASPTSTMAAASPTSTMAAAPLTSTVSDAPSTSSVTEVPSTSPAATAQSTSSKAAVQPSSSSSSTTSTKEASVSSASYHPGTYDSTSPADTASSPISSVTMTPSSTAVTTPTSTMAAAPLTSTMAAAPLTSTVSDAPSTSFVSEVPSTSQATTAQSTSSKAAVQTSSSETSSSTTSTKESVTTSAPTPEPSSTGLSGGAIFGIVLLCVFVVALAVLIVLYFLRVKGNKQLYKDEEINRYEYHINYGYGRQEKKKKNQKEKRKAQPTTYDTREEIGMLTQPSAGPSGSHSTQSKSKRVVYADNPLYQMEC